MLNTIRDKLSEREKEQIMERLNRIFNREDSEFSSLASHLVNNPKFESSRPMVDLIRNQSVVLYQEIMKDYPELHGF